MIPTYKQSVVVGLDRFLRNLRIAWGLFLAALLLAIRPIVDVRVQVLEARRLGHLALDPELWLSQRDECGTTDQLVVFSALRPICNRFLLRLWKRVLHIAPNWLIQPIYEAGHRYPRLNVTPQRWNPTHADLRVLDRTRPHIRLTTGESSAAQEYLRRHGIPESTPHVCLAIRDSAYLGTVFPRQDWGYHNFRDARIGDYVRMAEFLASRGYAVIRMGAVVAEQLRTNSPLVLDYATSPDRSELLDVSLFASCAFCISSSTGMDSLALAFRRPVGIANLPGVGGIRLGTTTRLVMLKDVYDLETNRRLSLLDPRWQRALHNHRSDMYEAQGLCLRPNSPDELVKFSAEMIMAVEGKLHIPSDQRLAQARILRADIDGYDRSLATAHFSPSWFADRLAHNTSS